MALLKTIDSKGSGHACSYWRLILVAVEHPERRVLVVFGGYKDAAARRQGLQPLVSVRATLTAETLGQTDLHLLTSANLYRAMRRHPLFADADDDLSGDERVGDVAAALEAVALS